ncbi:MAG: hypothetical protein U0872_08645 [Planctomycetaceae bacterium]
MRIARSRYRCRIENTAFRDVFWAVYYLVAPVSYIGSTHANMLEKLGNSDDINNLPSAMYLWLTFVPVVDVLCIPVRSNGWQREPLA